MTNSQVFSFTLVCICLLVIAVTLAFAVYHNRRFRRNMKLIDEIQNKKPIVSPISLSGGCEEDDSCLEGNDVNDDQAADALLDPKFLAEIENDPAYIALKERYIAWKLTN